jgi:CRP-like cAMP-binding protein
MAKRIKGVMLELGGEVFECPPLALGDLELLQDRLEAMKKSTSQTDRETVSTVIDATLAALNRNYPDLTRQALARLIDVGNMQQAMLAVMAVSGLERREEGKPAPVLASTGDGSMPTSPPEPAGPSSTSAST